MTVEVKKLAIMRDKSGIPTYARRLTKTFNIKMAADVNYTLPVPTGSSVAIFNASDEFFVSDSTITLPTAAFVESKALLAPTAITVEQITTLHFKADTSDTVLSVAFYSGCSAFEG